MIKRLSVYILTLLCLATATGIALGFRDKGAAAAKVNVKAKPSEQDMICKIKCGRQTLPATKVKDVHQAELPAYFDKLFAFCLPMPSITEFVNSFSQAMLANSLDKNQPNHLAI